LKWVVIIGPSFFAQIEWT